MAQPNNNDANLLFQVRQLLSDIRHTVYSANPTAAQLDQSMLELQGLQGYREFVEGVRGWEGNWLLSECQHLIDRIEAIGRGHPPQALLALELWAARDFAVQVEQALDTTLWQLPPDDLIDVSLDGQQQWLHLPEQPEMIRPVVVHRNRQLKSYLDKSDDEWFSWCRFPEPEPQPAVGAAADPMAGHNSRPKFFWFQRREQTGGMAEMPFHDHDSRYWVYMNMDPWDNMGLADDQGSPIWFDQSRVHVLSSGYYPRFIPARDRLRIIVGQVDRLNELLKAADLEWRIRRQQLPPTGQQRQHFEVLYRQTVDTVLRVRNRVTSECPQALANIDRRLAMFSRPGGGGLLVP